MTVRMVFRRTTIQIMGALDQAERNLVAGFPDLALDRIRDARKQLSDAVTTDVAAEEIPQLAPSTRKNGE